MSLNLKLFSSNRELKQIGSDATQVRMVSGVIINAMAEEGGGERFKLHDALRLIPLIRPPFTSLSTCSSHAFQKEIDQNFAPVGVQISPAHVTHAVSSEFSMLDDLEWLPPCGVDSDITKVCGDFLGTNDPEVLVAHTNVVDACMTASIQEQHSSAFSGHKMNNESIETVHSGFSFNSNGYCAFKR